MTQATFDTNEHFEYLKSAGVSDLDAGQREDKTAPRSLRSAVSFLVELRCKKRC